MTIKYRYKLDREDNGLVIAERLEKQNEILLLLLKLWLHNNNSGHPLITSPILKAAEEMDGIKLSE